ncbi:Protein CURVATURE THYLAKOID 1D chloroplastic [Bienertia sinuspersici]
MEICTTRGAVSAPSFPPLSSRRFIPNASHLLFLRFPGVASNTSRRTCLRATSDERSSSFTDKKSDGIVTFEDDFSSASVDNVSAKVNEKEKYYENKPVVESAEVGESSDNEFLQSLKEILRNLNIELDVEDSPTILLYGGGALLAVWLLSAIVGAIDSIPLFPKLMEVVGLGYSVWFTSRYLLFKKSREELGSKIEELKQEVLGSSNK